MVSVAKLGCKFDTAGLDALSVSFLVLEMSAAKM